ncbi:MAG: hypothetical protein J0G30_08815 [Actinomycetales bacterium]|nr:hypothetical protein [Actinomycetales bacterium]
MIAALLLVAVGAGDLARGARSLALGWVLAAVAWSATLALGLLGGAPPIAVSLAVLGGVAWSMAAEGLSGSRSTPLPVVALLAIAVVVALAADGALPAPPPTVLGAEVARLAGGATLARVLLVLGAVLVLLRTANLIVRATLVQAVDRRLEPVAGRPAASGWRVRLGSREIGAVEPVVAASAPSRLRGGRIIGPLERGFVLALALLGAWAALGALVAAKGIVRFPEISRDRPSGSKAEEFLIGSLASWAVAGALALLLAVHPA